MIIVHAVHDLHLLQPSYNLLAGQCISGKPTVSLLPVHLPFLTLLLG